MRYYVRYRHLADSPGMTYTRKFPTEAKRGDFLATLKYVEIRLQWEEVDGSDKETAETSAVEPQSGTRS